MSDRDLEKIGLIKIDVEGAEEEVLRGFTSISKTDAPIVFEYRVDVLQKDLNQSGKELISELEKNFKLFGIKIIDNQIMLIDFDSTLPVANAIGLPLRNWQEYFLKLSPSLST